jgi:hypothetical protein
MAGSKVNDYGVGDVDLTSLMTTVDTQRIGFHSVSLTEYDTTTKPEIAAGSKIEVNGGLYKFDSNEAITGTPADGTVYVKVIAADSSITAEFTATAPTWSDSKQGWYGTAGASNHRYLNFAMTKSGSNYSDKRYYLHDPQKNIKNFQDITCDDAKIETLDLSNFITQTISTSGLVDLGPVVIQWDIFNVNTGGDDQALVNYHTAFSTGTLAVVATPRDGTGEQFNIGTRTSTGFDVHTESGASGVNLTGIYIAIGY